MSVIEAIFEDHLERKFRVKPDPAVDREKSARMNRFEKEFSMSKEQAEKLEQLFFEICCDYQQMGFSDGFKTAFDLMFEVAGMVTEK